MNRILAATIMAGALLVSGPIGLARAKDAAFTGRGNEPSWHVKISDTAITFAVLGEEPLIITPPPKATQGRGARSYSAVIQGQRLSLTVSNRICTDTMSGMPHPKSVEAIWGGRRFSGCGGEPAELLHGQWLIETIAGKAALPGSRPTIAFGAGHRASGSTACNRFTGRYALTGESLSIVGLALTRRACKPPVTEQERTIVAALGSTTGFAIDSTGQLTLLTGDGRVLTARKK